MSEEQPKEKSLGWLGLLIFGVPIVVIIILAVLKVI